MSNKVINRLIKDIKMKLTNISILISFLIVFKISAQGEFGTVTPTTADFMRYGEVPVSFFNGKINYEIPIHQIIDSDFSNVISVIYTSDGFKPAKRSGFVGHDWFLNAGGCITREAYYIPDDIYPIQLEGEGVGYWWAIENNIFSNNAWWNFSDSIISCNQDRCDGPMKDGFFCDYQQDLFMFNFAGHSGQFMIDNQRNIKTNIQGYSVDLSSFNIQYNDNILPDMSQIIIKTPDGYSYYFGGELSALEFTMTFEPGVLLAHPKPTILAWHLTRIVAPNSRTLKFNYTHVDLTDADTKKTSPIWQSSKTKVPQQNGLPRDAYKAIKTVVLESIEIEDVNYKVEFIKSQEVGFNSFYSNNYPDYNYPCYKLDSIKVSYNNQLKDVFSFDYEMKDKRRFLTRVTNFDKDYTFTYNHATLYPIPEIQYNTDFYGYWTANNTQNSLGLLSRIKYPTGGYTNLTYERNYYSKRVELNYNTLENNLITIGGETGGARIRKIESFLTDNTKVEQKEYIYVNNSISTGILYQYPPRNDSAFIQTDIWVKNYNISEPHIGYSSVIEKYADNSFVKYTFSDYESNTDGIDVKFSSENLQIDPLLFILANVNRVVSNSHRRGLLLRKTYHDVNGNIIKGEINDYRSVSNIEEEPLENDIINFKSVSGGGMVKRIQLQYHPLIYKKDSLSALINEQFFAYNDLDLLKEQKVVKSNNDTVKTIYKYPIDFKSSQNMYETISANNIHNLIVEEKKFNNNNCIFTKKNIYKLPPMSILPILDSVKTSLSDGPFDTQYICHKNDSCGNPIYITTKEAVDVVYLWSLGDKFPFAEIKNATYNDVKNSLGGIFPEKISSSSVDIGVIASMLRNNTQYLSKSQITTYTFNPLVGVITKTDPRGVTTNYEYDDFNRLEYIKDTNGNIIQKFDYHYKE